ncbi:superoxide dismutase [Candidimonas sp. SYP-B2681]|uniref:SMP-30/gluconolactonase/LRE family protein n=1 Tax=Candidimonas sp. SYP-B2681 TaxID=2497686 RepID=UPI000F892897|nr:superoxide dismutase [Candidimonas sp. SYP-B2681]RTZ40975.1 superoxide dismutase [Candidimonas sp. SYP-B2681]
MLNTTSRFICTVFVATSLLIGIAEAAEGSRRAPADNPTPTGGIQTQDYPVTLAMPQGSVPEGIAIKGSIAFVTSLSHGAVYKLDLATGAHEVLNPGESDSAAGILLDEQGRLYVAGARGGSVQVIDSNHGKTLANYRLAADEKSFVNDVARLNDAIYATDSFAPVIYKLPLGKGGALPEQTDIKTIPLSGISYVEGFNANGISTTPDGKALLVVQMNTGVLYRVDPASGVAAPVDIGGTDLKGGDGLLREGKTLYVVRNIPNTIAVLELDEAGTTARLKTELKDPRFDTPTTIARLGDRLYLPNARLTLKDPENADFTVTAISYKP